MSTLIKPFIQIDPELMEQSEEKGIVTVHCTIKGYSSKVRQWIETYLFADGSSHQSKLMHAEKITMYPNWTYVHGNGYRFTLYFEALPKECESFTLQEVIPEPGGWVAKGIRRNESDVYNINL